MSQKFKLSQKHSFQQITGFLIVLFWVFSALMTHLFFDSEIILTDRRLYSPSWSSWLGYDAMGRPLHFMLAKGAGSSLLIAFLALILQASLGSVLGAWSAHEKGWVDLILSRVKDVLLSFPPLILPLALTAFFGGGFLSLILALTIRGWVGYAKVMRAQVLQFENREFVIYSKHLGVSFIHILVKHILPNSYEIFAIKSAFVFRALVIYEASLSFLGLGLQENQISWGRLLFEGREYLLEAPHIFLGTSLSVSSLILGLILLTKGSNPYR
jgi:peptide/nickel transport system permease protein